MVSFLMPINWTFFGDPSNRSRLSFLKCDQTQKVNAGGSLLVNMFIQVTYGMDFRGDRIRQETDQEAYRIYIIETQRGKTKVRVLISQILWRLNQYVTIEVRKRDRTRGRDQES